MKTFIFLLLVTYVYGQTQNLCGTTAPAPGTFLFVDDPSACDAYLWCNFQNNALASVHQGKCPDGFNFNAGSCDGSFVCTAQCEFNTGTTRVAVPTDTECKTYVVCTDATVGTDITTCPGTSVFNRNFGSCTPPRVAPCETSSNNPNVPVACNETVRFINDPSSCAGFFFCDGNVARPDQCPPPLHFNPDELFCDEPTNLNPPCVDTIKSTFIGPQIPKPPLRNVKAAAKRRLMSKTL
ncbi:hypothetical protein PVAND_009756 [Polypedilum vanderplanki]|uniref:Chitin-binding type-2 domain-containing protein n=1 Tax=Polypedilum vanderplanki TaxID=319348 RepID=A0A9J6CDH5_POLVA|nr:hypothetical protein PVAND_009756 [Polypedilum vanderplanki]